MTDLVSSQECGAVDCEVLRALYKKALDLRAKAPGLALTAARQTAEAICTDILIRSGKEFEINKIQHPDLKKLLACIGKSIELPEVVLLNFGTILAHGGFGAHFQGEKSYLTEQPWTQSCLEALKFICDWHSETYGLAVFTSNRGERIRTALDMNPYMGLEPFGPTMSDRFYGRESESVRLEEKLLGHHDTPTPLVVVVGSSGSGKSSLVGAGLIPRLGNNRNSGPWAWVRTCPGDAPIEMLVCALASCPEARASGTRESDLVGLITTEGGLCKIIDQLFPGKPFLFWIDQFEEIFVHTDKDRRDSFLLLLKPVLERNDIRIVVTIRAEFYHVLLSEVPIFERYFERAHFPLSPPRENALVRTIEGPARSVGLSIQPELLGRLLFDAGEQPGSLPLLQFALKSAVEKYRLSRRGDDTLRLDDYIGIRYVIAERAERSVSKHAISDAVIHRVFSQLVEVLDNGIPVRKRARIADIIGRNPHAEKIVDTLVQDRILVSNADNCGEGIVEVAHEAIFEHWPRLAEWIRENGEALRCRNRIQSSSSDWAQSGKRKEFLLADGRLLTEACQILYNYPHLLAECDRVYVEKSIEEVVRVRRKRVVVAGGFAILIFGLVFALSVIAFWKVFSP